jgi:branched-chain amino acid aminotransferase
MQSVIADPSANETFLWRNGKIEAWESSQVHVSAVGHASVASVFEGVKAYWCESKQELYCFRLSEHMERLISSARLARVECKWTLEELVNGTLDLLRANGTKRDTYIRPWLFAKGLVRDQMVPAGVATELVIDTWPFATASPDRAVSAGVSTWTRISERLMPPRIKAFSNYSNGRLGVIEAQMNGYDCPIFLNELGMVTESAGACIGLIRKGVVYTPPLSAGILDSITRDTLLTLLPELGYTVHEKDLTRTDLYVADEAFFMGTGWEVLPVKQIDHMIYRTSAPGRHTQRIRAAYLQLVRGESSQHCDWLTLV